MIKENKGKLLISSVAILLPILAGLLMWEALPERMATHWGADGNADGFSIKFFAVFAIPVFLLALHWVCILITLADPKSKNQSKKAFNMIFWILPIISVYSSAIMYATAFDMDFNIGTVTLILVCLMFVVIGNYLPKCKQNKVLGVKVKWTLENEENWNMTHRFAGRIWVLGGLLMMMVIFLPETVVPHMFMVGILSLALIPIFYSYAYHRKQLREGGADGLEASAPTDKPSSTVKIISLLLAVITVIGVGILLFTGNIEIKYTDTAFTIEASYWNDMTIDYAEIENIEYREKDSPGSRTFGFGSLRLLMGSFRNEEFGNYTRYSYAGCSSCVVLTIQGDTLVINGPDDEETREIYEVLFRHASAPGKM